MRKQLIHVLNLNTFIVIQTQYIYSNFDRDTQEGLMLIARKVHRVILDE